MFKISVLALTGSSYKSTITSTFTVWNAEGIDLSLSQTQTQPQQTSVLTWVCIFPKVSAC